MLLGIHMCLPLCAGRVHWLNATVFSACALGDAQLVRPPIKHAALLGGTAKGVHCVWHGRLWTQGLQEGAKPTWASWAAAAVAHACRGAALANSNYGHSKIGAFAFVLNRCWWPYSAMQASCCCCCRACAACHT